MQEIIKINDYTYRIEDDGVRFFLLLGDKEALTIDTGMNSKNAYDICSSLTKLPIKLLNTHADIDHISGNENFKEVYMSQKEWDYYKTLRKNDIDIHIVKEDDIIDLGNRPLKIIDLPGHTKGSIAVLDINNRVLIGGDSIQNGRIYMFGERRNMKDYILTLQALWDKHKDEFDIVYPSHSSFPASKDLIPLIIEGAKKILDEKVQGSIINMMGKEIMYYDLGFAGFLCEA